MKRFGVVELDAENTKNISPSERKKKEYKAAFFDNRSGGFYVCQKGHNYFKEEIEAARYLALNGYHVIMQPEGDGSGGISLRLAKSGHKSYPEGKIGALWYEQYTPLGGTVKQMKEGIMHAHEKGAEIAVLFDKYAKFNSTNIKDGMKRYRGQKTNHPKSVKKLLIITKLPKSRRWGVYEWQL